MKTVNVTLVGVGGQGIILTADLLALTAAKAGLEIKKSEIHGMAQRGGSVMAQVRFGSDVAAPVIGEGDSDVLVSFDKLEAVRSAHCLKAGGVALVNDAYLTPVTVSSGQQRDVEDLDGRVRSIPGLKLIAADAIAQDEIGNARTANMVLAGALSASCPFDVALWHEAMAELLAGPKAKLLDINRRAFDRGRAAAEALS